MSYFPMCVDLTDKEVVLIGDGEQIREKIEKISDFDAQLLRQMDFTEEDAEKRPAAVIVGDLPLSEEERISNLCKAYNIPVNVVDVIPLCTFFFPSIIKKGQLTVSVSTGGHCPGAGVYIKKQVEKVIPERTAEIIDWISKERLKLREKYSLSEYKPMLSGITKEAFRLERPLTEDEITQLLGKY